MGIQPVKVRGEVCRDLHETPHWGETAIFPSNLQGGYKKTACSNTRGIH